MYVDKCQVGCTGWEWKPHNEQYLAHGQLPLRLGISSTIHPLLLQGVLLLMALSWIQDFYCERRWIWENVAAKKVKSLLPRPSFASSCADYNLQSIFFMNLIVDSVSIEATNIQSTHQIFFQERTQNLILYYVSWYHYFHDSPLVKWFWKMWISTTWHSAWDLCMHLFWFCIW